MERKRNGEIREARVTLGDSVSELNIFVVETM